MSRRGFWKAYLGLAAAVLACLMVGAGSMVAEVHYKPAPPDYSTSAPRDTCPTEDSCEWARVGWFRWDWVPVVP